MAELTRRKKPLNRWEKLQARAYAHYWTWHWGLLILLICAILMFLGGLAIPNPR